MSRLSYILPSFFGAALAFYTARSVFGQNIEVSVIFDKIIPFFAGTALLVSTYGVVAHVIRIGERRFLSNHNWPKFGRKGLVISGASVLFTFSCLYRSVFVADEGAAMCRGEPSAFNAPASGRSVATVGEIALVVQISAFLEDSARRVGAKSTWTSRKTFTLLPVFIAETFSWSGVLSGDSRFYCCEYIVWMLIALTWVWDSGEVLHKAVRFGDKLAFSLLLLAGLGLFFFNAFLEIPHFFAYRRESPESIGGGIWECFQDADSPLWVKRLPFFFCYFFGCSWCSVAVSYRYFRRGYPMLGGSISRALSRSKSL